MMSRQTSVRVGSGLAIALLLCGASLPRAMAGPGVWEVGKTAGGRGEQLCLPDPAILMQWEHRGKACTRNILNAAIDRADVHYSCPDGGFGTSRVQVLTPRSIKVSTQGIANGLPFGYVIHARRVGNCGP